MSVMSAAIYTVLSGDATLSGLLAPYKGRPAIFTYEPVPKTADKPYVVTVGEISDEPDDTKTSTGRRMVRDIRVYAAQTGSSAAIETISERIRTLLHRVDLSVTGFKTIYVSVSGPTVVDEEDVYGRALSVELQLATL